MKNREKRNGEKKREDRIVPSGENQATVAEWMTKNPYTVPPEATIEEAIRILDEHDIFSIPVVSPEGDFLGLVTKTILMQLFLKDHSLDTPVRLVMMTSPPTIRPGSPIALATEMKDGALPVVDDAGKLVGIITRTDILNANSGYIKLVKDRIDSSETLKQVLNSAYEGIVVIDKNGIIREFNDAYSRFIGKSPEEVIGKNVDDIIENTRLPIVVKTGIEERGHIQRIHGQDMVVHRIPIKKGDEITGAIGMLIFEDVNELYNIIGRIHKGKEGVRNGRVVFSKKEQFHLEKIIGSSELMLKAKELAKRAARTPSTVLITGDSGTGKELFAQAIHDMSLFSEGSLVSVNCSAIPEALLESELFGYEEGAFTDARKGGKKGKFELAHNGTLFLDEIGDMPLFMQAKILRALQDRYIEPVGSTQKKKVNVRIITATNKNLEEMVKKGTFREDLYYRINIIRLELPRLRDRREDIPELVTRFIRKFCTEFGFRAKTVSRDAMALLTNYDWPGNVREVLNVSEMLVSLVDKEVIEAEDLPERFRSVDTHRSRAEGEDAGSGLRQAVRNEERQLLLKTLAECGGNKAEAARKLGIQRSTLYEKLKRHGIA